LEEGLDAFDGFLVFGSGGVYESDEPTRDEGRLERAR